MQQIHLTFARLAPHDLRHTIAGRAIPAGGNAKVIQRMLGHSSAAMTLDVCADLYADLFDDDLDTLATALNFPRSRSSKTFGTPNVPYLSKAPTTRG